MVENDTNAGFSIEISNWLLQAVNAVNRLHAEMKQPVTKIRHARLLAVSIILREFPDEEERELLDQWEKTSFRIFGLCRKDARTGVGDFVRLAREIQKNLDLSSHDLSEKIRQIEEGIFVHRIGNLLLLPPCLNSILVGKDRKEKADDYRQTGLLSAGEIAETICKYGWGEAQIETRENEITGWIYGEFL